MAKKRVLSGIKPSGIPTLGNYIGAITQWVELQSKYDCLFPIVDLHALTPYQPAKELSEHSYTVAALALASGIDPKKSIIFAQSHVPAHSELSWLLSTVTSMGELSRMTQFKDKSAKTKDSDRVELGLFLYPVLMAADILLYDTDIVPVGDDQKQHVELSRNLAQKFNSRYGKVFKVPTPVIRKEGARIMSLDDPEKKMSKSDDSALGYILLTDSPDEIRKKIMRAVTDSGSTIKFDPNRPGLYNLLTIYKILSGQTEKQIEKHFEDRGYGDFKRELAEVIVSHLAPIQKEMSRYLKNRKLLDKILADGAKQANKIATAKLAAVKQKMGLI